MRKWLINKLLTDKEKYFIYYSLDKESTRMMCSLGETLTEDARFMVRLSYMFKFKKDYYK